VPARHRAKVECIRAWLVHTLEHNALPPIDRALAGDALAHLGDPRFHGEEFWCLPDDDLLGFVEIPAGTFRMGSAADDDSAFDDEKEAHDVDLPTYYIARYPVTVAQFCLFVGANPEYRWEGESRPQGPWNHPVVWVSWYDAVAYCKWLTACLQERWDGLPERLQKALHGRQWQIILPSEAEWEKAARGTDGRRYPWGNEPDPNLANYDETGIGSTSAVGCFPGGASPYGLDDMSGNVWEWTRSLYENYPYPESEVVRAKREVLWAHRHHKTKPHVVVDALRVGPAATGAAHVRRMIPEGAAAPDAGSISRRLQEVTLKL
jgi:formylglycine-generating enzyme required for sulfatase activity